MAEVGLGMPPGSGSETLTAAGVAALLHWWKLAGVDTPTSDVPTGWLGDQAEPSSTLPEPLSAPRPARTRPAHRLSPSGPIRFGTAWTASRP